MSTIRSVDVSTPEGLVDADAMEDGELVDPRRLSRRLQSDSAPGETAATPPELVRCLSSLQMLRLPVNEGTSRSRQDLGALSGLASAEPETETGQCNQLDK